jgi:hypothetical protein
MALASRWTAAATPTSPAINTTSSNFPTTAGAFQTTLGGSGLTFGGNAFVTKLNGQFLFPGSPPPPPNPAPPPGILLASPIAVFTFLVKKGKHWFLQIWNSDPADPFLGWLLLEGLSKKQARSLGLPNASTPVFLFLPQGGVSLLALPFTPSGNLTGFAF